MRALHAGSPDWAATQPQFRSISWPVDDRRMLAYRVDALDLDPTSAPYLLHLVLDGDARLVGRIGCHAAPDDAGEVEIGYFVQEADRGRGIAGHAVDQFLIWLRANGVTRVRATARPDNEVSIKILTRRGFVEVGSQIDPEDGLEFIYQRTLGT